MAAKGSESKEIIIKKILDSFPNSFLYGKEIRIPMDEDGERVEIKVTLTCAKVNVGGGEPAQETSTEVSASPISSIPTEEEKRNVADLLAKLGI